MQGDPWGGSEELWAATAYTAIDKNHQVGVFVYRRTPLVKQIVQISQAGAQVFYRPLPKYQNRLERLIQKIQPEHKYLIKQLLQFKPDVVLLSQGGTFDIAHPESVTVCNFLYENRIPYIIVCHRNEDTMIACEATQKLMRDVFSQAHLVMFVAEQNMKSARRQIVSSISNGLVVKNPVNLHITSPPAWPQAQALSMASVGRLDVSYKGQDLLLEALSSQLWKSRDWSLALYGNGPDQNYIEQLVDFYALQDHVHFAGHVSDIRQVWADHNLAVLPSRKEGTPLALIEAMLCARPSLVTDVGGNTEWIEHQKTGFIAEAASVNSIRKALEEVWQSQSQLEQLGKSAHSEAMLRVNRDPGLTMLNHLLEISQKTQTNQ